MRDGEEAVKLATKACELTRYRNPAALDVPAAAYAAAGRYPEAVQWGQVALGIARAVANKELAQGIERRLELYRRQKPFVRPESP